MKWHSNVAMISRQSTPHASCQHRRNTVFGPTAQSAVTPSNALEKLFLSLTLVKAAKNCTESNVNGFKADVRTSTRFSVTPREALKRHEKATLYLVFLNLDRGGKVSALFAMIGNIWLRHHSEPRPQAPPPSRVVGMRPAKLGGACN